MKNYPVIKFTILFVAGILIEPLISVDSILLIVFISSLTFSFIVVKVFTNKCYQYLLFPVIVLIGSLSSQIDQPRTETPIDDIYKIKNIRTYGEVESVELIKKKEIIFTVIADSVFYDSLKLSGSIRFLCKDRREAKDQLYVYENLLPGNKINLIGSYYKGRERRNPGEFDYNKYLRFNGITGTIILNPGDSLKIVKYEKNEFASRIFSTRKSLDRRIRSLHEPETAGLLRGLLLADRSEIDYETKTKFINSGVIHVLAVSGLHVGFILLIFLVLFGRLNFYLKAVLTVSGLLFFLILTGAPPSVFRATLMAIIIIAALLLNRSTNLLNSISIAALILLIIDPSEIYNPGFQLSFSAVIAIALLYPVFNRWINRLSNNNKFLKYLLLFIAVSLSAQIGTLPFTLSYFGKLSLVALLANIIIIPAIGIIVATGITTILVSFISSLAASYFAAANDLFVELIFSLIRFTGRLDFSFIPVHNFSLYDGILFYLALLLIYYIYSLSKNLIFKTLVFLLIAANFFLYASVDDKNFFPDGELTISAIDVGQGDSFFIKLPNNKTILIDAGETNPFFDNGERVVYPFLQRNGIEKIDYGFITHLDVDHYGGFIHLIEKNMISEIYKPAYDSTSKKDSLFERFARMKNIPIKYYNRKIIKEDDVRIYILNIDKFNLDDNHLSQNNRSGIIKIVYGEFETLFVGDIETEIENYYTNVYQDFLQSDLLKVAHHGSKTSSTDDFLNLTDPDFAIISAGTANKFGHPDEIVLNRLKEREVNILRTDLSGALFLSTDGKRIYKHSWK